MPPRNRTICPSIFFDIIWCVGYSGALLMYSLYLQDDRETNFPKTQGGGPVAACTLRFAILPLRNSSHCLNPDMKRRKRESSESPEPEAARMLFLVCLSQLLTLNYTMRKDFMACERTWLSVHCKNQWWTHKRRAKLHSDLHSRIALNLRNESVALYWLEPLICLSARLRLFTQHPHNLTWDKDFPYMAL